MDDQVQDRSKTGTSSESPPTQQSIPCQATVEDCEETAAQSPGEGGAEYPTPPSSSSKMDHAATNVQPTTSTPSGSSVTQLAPSDDTVGPKSSGNRNRMLREPKNSKIKAAHRLGGVTTSGAEPNSAAYETFPSSPPDLGYFKVPPKGRQVPASAYTPRAVPLPINANFPQSPISPVPFTVWGPNPSLVGYPPSHGQFSPQLSRLPPADQNYRSGFAHVNSQGAPLDAPYSHHPSLYDQSYQTAEDQLADQGNENMDLPLERLNGYASLAARVSGQLEPRLKPVYRRFDWLHHRALLYYQDQLAALEQELMRIDSITARESGHMPISGREERNLGHEIHRHRHRVMEKIERLLRQYKNTVMSLEDMHKLPAPTSDEVQAYRAFLNHPQLLVEAETKFLGAEDLAALAQRPAADTAGDGQAVLSPPAQVDVPLRVLANGFSVSFLCLAMLLVALPDFASRLVMVVCYGVLVATVLSATGHLGRLRQLFEG
ncbi:hypothetical protein F66182_617 [Fusarium sp. NRRL 66182]|nr:hypothetical protein F66182_617 [Fusarium sp. NRRL 66182]